MALKPLLDQTDFIKGWDKRFATSVVIGFVSKIECDSKHANVRVILPDRKDHNGTPLITRAIPVMQVASAAKRSFAIPRLGTPVLLAKLPNSTSDYMVVGSFYTPTKPPPVTDPKLDYTIYDDGSVIKIDANDGASVTLTWDFKGGITITTQKDININAQNGSKVTVIADSDIALNSTGGKAIITANEIDLNGDVVHTGNMTTSGIHNAADGPHSSCGLAEADSALDERIKALEARIAQLERRISLA